MKKRWFKLVGFNGIQHFIEAYSRELAVTAAKQLWKITDDDIKEIVLK